MLVYVVTVAVSAFFVPHYLSIFWEPLRTNPWDIVVGVIVIVAPRRAQRRRRPGGREALDHAGRGRLRDSGPAGDHRLRARLQRRRAHVERPLGSCSYMAEPRGRDPGCDARVHGGGDGLESRGGGSRPGSDRAECLQGRCGRRLRDLLHAAVRRAVRSARRADRRRADDAAGASPRRGRIRERPHPRSRAEPRHRRGLAARRNGDLRRRARGDDPLHRDQRGRYRCVEDHLLDGELQAAARDLPAAASAAEDALALARRLRRNPADPRDPAGRRQLRRDALLARRDTVLHRRPHLDRADADAAALRRGAPVPSAAERAYGRNRLAALRDRRRDLLRGSRSWFSSSRIPLRVGRGSAGSRSGSSGTSSTESGSSALPWARR